MTSLSRSSLHCEQTFCRFEELSIKKSNSMPHGINDGLPIGTSRLESQVAGHPFDYKKNTVGMLKGSSGRVLKPVVKPILGDREIAFYENLQTTQDPTLLELKKYVPKYYGTTELQIFDKRVKFLTLKDITEGMAEPCVMDIKIGEQTWDPLASDEKRKSEEEKYAESKRVYGFCIPGFHVYSLSSDGLKKYGKDYGKRLNAKTTIEALRIFFNARPGKPPCRQLIVKLLSLLWKILLFFRNQRKLRFYSSSLLVTYDAQRLRHYLRLEDDNQAVTFNDNTFGACQRTRSFSSLSPKNNKSYSWSTSVDGTKSNRTSNSPLFAAVIKANRNKALDRVRGLKRSISLSSGCESTQTKEVVSLNRCNSYGPDSGMEVKNALNRSSSYGSDFRTEKLCRTHSFSHNFDEEIARMKEEYKILLNELSSSCEEKQNWVRVNMIDFTHVFPAEHDQNLDVNYLKGIENLIKLVETFLVPENT